MVVYGLFLITKPNEIRYVGQTRSSLSIRLKGHYKDAQRLDNPVQRWLRKNKGQVGIRVLCENPIWDETEKEIIADLKKTKRLLNISDGGTGGNLGPLVCQKLRETMAVVSKSPEYRKKLSDGQKRRGKRGPKPEETKRKISTTLTGRKCPQNSDPLYRQKLSKSLTGKKKTEAHRKAISLSCMGRPNVNKGVPRSTEVRERIRQSLLGRKLSQEHRQRISEGMRRANG